MNGAGMWHGRAKVARGGRAIFLFGHGWENARDRVCGCFVVLVFGMCLGMEAWTRG